jgi:hypothetical protein
VAEICVYQQKAFRKETRVEVAIPPKIKVMKRFFSRLYPMVTKNKSLASGASTC